MLHKAAVVAQFPLLWTSFGKSLVVAAHIAACHEAVMKD